MPVAGSLGALFGVCANEFSADGQVVHLEYGCGAHSEVEIPSDTGPAVADAYDDAAVDVVVLPQQLAATARARSAADDRTDDQAASGHPASGAAAPHEGGDAETSVDEPTSAD